MQLVRFAIVGLSVNLALYGVYLVLTRLGTGHLVAAVAVFMLGMASSFAANQHWTFTHRGRGNVALWRFAAAYAAALVANLGLLYAFVDKYGFPHAFVQAASVILIAALLFLLLKYWVFQ